MPLAVAVAACLIGLERPASASMQLATVTEAKAAFLYNFARFTEFPDAAFSTASSPFAIGIVDHDVLRLTLDTVVRGKTIGGRALKVRNVKDTKDLADIQMLFIGHSGVRMTDLLRALDAQPVLTVGDGERFCREGGMIAFLLEGGRMRFEVRFEATKRAGLKVSPRVLTLAKATHEKS